MVATVRTWEDFGVCPRVSAPVLWLLMMVLVVSFFW